eukprot:4024167-Prymnesium_polylepis.1
MRVEGTRQGVLSPDLVGVLAKQADERKLSLSRWRKRRFELKNGSLHYYEPEAGGKLKGEIKLSDPSTDVLEDATKADPSLGRAASTHAFAVRTAGRVWVLQAASGAEKERWVRMIRERVGRAAEPLRTMEDIGVTTVL